MKLENLIWFIGSFIAVYLFYFFYQIFKKEYNNLKVPIELVYLIKKYNLDMSKIKYRRIMNKIGLISAFDIAFTSTFILAFIKNIYLAILIGAVMLIPLILITFNYIGKYYVKKGCVLNGNKKNRK